jgi:DNA repair photolyase
MTTRHHKGRGAVSDREGRFATRPVEFEPEEAHHRAQESPETVVRSMRTGRIIATNSSPDVPFDRSINPYQGCEHGCVYCYARPSHSYLDLSPGLDFETKIFYKPDAAARLADEWEKSGYTCEPHPVSLITKSNLIVRDLDIFERLAKRNLCSVAISIPTMDAALKRILEPRIPSASARLAAITELARIGVPVSVLLAPVIPAINDGEIEAILAASSDAGATQAAYIFLRLPHEVRDLFVEWLETHYPDRANHVMSLIRQASGGRDYDHRFGVRQTGRGPYADMLGKRFQAACTRHGLNQGRYQKSLDCSRFDPPGQKQLGLF